MPMPNNVAVSAPQFSGLNPGSTWSIPEVTMYLDFGVDMVARSGYWYRVEDRAFYGIAFR